MKIVFSLKITKLELSYILDFRYNCAGEIVPAIKIEVSDNS